MSREMGAYANLLNADRQAFIKAMLTKRGESGSTLTVICGQATPSCSAFFQQGRCPMTDAGWAAGRNVKEAGWYWWDEKGLPLKAVHIEKGFTFNKYDGLGGRDVMYVVGYGGFLKDKPGRFLGPISPNDRQQGRVEGLREAKENLERLENRDTRLQTDVEDFYVWIDDQLAQAAQDEKGVGGW